MKQAFRLYRRSGIYYCHNNDTGQQESLRTSDKCDAKRLVHAKNEAACMGTLNLQIARAYMVAVDPHMPERTWREVIRFIIEQKEEGPSRHRWESVEKDSRRAERHKGCFLGARPNQGARAPASQAGADLAHRVDKTRGPGGAMERLTKEIGEQSAMLVGFFGALEDAVGQAPGGAATVEALIKKDEPGAVALYDRVLCSAAVAREEGAFLVIYPSGRYVLPGGEIVVVQASKTSGLHEAINRAVKDGFDL